MNINRFSRYAILAGIILFYCLFSCTERIDINTGDSPPRLVIYGYITTDTTQHAIRITRSTSYFATSQPEGISNATVSISSDNEVFELKESPDEPGLYLTLSDVYGTSGKTYTLRASLDFHGNGTIEEFEAISYLPFPATLDSAAAIPFPVVKNHLQVLIWGKLPEESSNNFSFHLYRNGTAINDSLKDFNIAQDDYIETKEIKSLPVFFLDQENDRYRLLSGDTLAVQVSSITSEYATFIENAISELRGTIPLFGGPPANIGTNIRCLSPESKTGISGFFTAYSIRRTVTVHE
jgi:hypothetical protein